MLPQKREARRDTLFAIIPSCAGGNDSLSLTLLLEMELGGIDFPDFGCTKMDFEYLLKVIKAQTKSDYLKLSSALMH